MMVMVAVLRHRLFHQMAEDLLSEGVDSQQSDESKDFDIPMWDK